MANSENSLLMATLPLLGASREELGPAYLEYIFEVSNAAWAISLELAAFLLALCRARKPAAIADLGSGFSSFVFRRYALASDQHVRVVSADDASDWLARTREFLVRQGLSTEALLPWEGFAGGSRDKFDLVFHDLGDMSVRAASLDAAIDLAYPDAVIVLDDLHMDGYLDHVQRAARNHGRGVLDLGACTRDATGRYACALVPESEPS